MRKYSRDLDEELVNKVKKMAQSVGLFDAGINIEAIKLNKTKNSIGEVLQGNELVKLFTGDDNLVAVAIYEDAFRMVDEQTQDIWIEGLLSQISYDMEKDKVVITKPEIQIGVGMYKKYGNIVAEKAELAIYTIDQIHEMEKQK